MKLNIKLKLSLMFGLFSGMVLLPGAAENEWPILHNVCHTGYAASTLLKPPLKAKWTAKVPGAFKAGPVVAEGKVVLQSRDGYLFCFDAETGAPIWRYFVQRMQAHYMGFTETGPCIWNGRVYANFFSAGHFDVSGMRCFDLNTGEMIWRKDAGYTEHRIHYSPQVSKGRLFFCSNREIRGTLGPNRSDYPYHAQVQCWDALTGDTLWTYTMATRICQNTTLLVVGDTIFASAAWTNNADSGKTVAFDTDGNILWQSTTHHVSNYTGNLQYADGKLWMLTAGSAGQRIIDTKDWSVVLNAGAGDCYTKVSAMMNGKYYNRSYGGWAVPVSSTTGVGTTFLSKYGQGAGSGCGAPVTGNGYIYNVFGGGGGKVYPEGTTISSGMSFDAGYKIVASDEAGNIVWWFQDRSHHCASVAIAYDKLYATAGTEGLIYCFENK